MARKRRDDDDEAAFVVADAGAGGAVALARSKRWNGLSGSNTVSRWPIRRTLRPGPRMGGDEMAGAAGLGHVDPAHLEAERLELGAHHLADCGHAVEVQGAAVRVHQPLEQGDGAIGLAVDRGRHRPALRGRGGPGRGRRGRAGAGEKRARMTSHSVFKGPGSSPGSIL